MCGIMGFVKTGQSTVFQKGVVLNTLAAIEERGPHASGYAIWDGKQVLAGKAPIPSSKLAKTKRLGAIVKRAQLMIGHARWATHGDWHDNKNNHPFWSDNNYRWCLVHNGILTDSDLPGEAVRGDCDSERILRIIERIGDIREAWKQITRTVHGNYACLVLDNKRGRLYAFRNDGRPIVVANLHMEIGGVVLASTAEIAHRAAKVGGVELWPGKVRELATDTLYCFQPGEVKPFVVSRVTRKPRRRSYYGQGQFRFPNE